LFSGARTGDKVSWPA